MADEKVRTQTLGLNTDLPPDRLEERAFQNCNVVPKSNQTVAPRWGESKIASYTLAGAGRALYVDDCPERSDTSVIIVAVNTTNDGGLAHAIEGVTRHGQNVNEFGTVELDPNDMGGIDWSEGGDSGRSAFVYGFVYSTPAGGADPIYPVKVNVRKQTITSTAYADSFGDTQNDTPAASAVIPLRRFDSTYRQYGVVALMLFRDADPDTTIVRGFYDMNDDDSLDSPEHETTVAGVLPSALVNKINVAGIAPLQNGFNAYLCWYPTADADPPNCAVEAYVRTSVTTLNGSRRTVEEQRVLSTTEWVMDVCPFSKQTEMFFLIALGKTSDSVQATGYFSFSANPADSDTFTVNGVSLTWKDVPNGTSEVQRGGSDDASITNLAAHLNTTLAANSSINVATYVANTTDDRLEITYDTGGTGGNAFTLAESSSAMGVSGATLSGGTDADSHLLQYKLTLKSTGYANSGDDDLITFTDQWSGGIALTHASWATRPDTVLCVQPTPAITGLSQWIVALTGDLYEDTEAYGVTTPRLALIDFDGVPQWTHTNGYGTAWGMCLNQHGEIYVTATKEIMAGKDYLIARYDSRFEDFGALEAFVRHGDNGLGDYTEDPEETRVLRPIWTGNELVVQDHGPTSTYVYVYDRDLNFQRKYELVTDDPADGARWLVNRFCAPWFGETY